MSRNNRRRPRNYQENIRLLNIFQTSQKHPENNFNTLPLDDEHSLCFILKNLRSLFLGHFCFTFLRSMIYLELLPESQDSLEDQVKFWGPSFANITFIVIIQD